MQHLSVVGVGSSLASNVSRRLTVMPSLPVIQRHVHFELGVVRRNQNDPLALSRFEAVVRLPRDTIEDGWTVRLAGPNPHVMLGAKRTTRVDER